MVATVGGEEVLNLAAALSGRSTFFETPFAEGWFKNSWVSML